jgi:alginate O-acetyltransferase complex protein AlgJ
MSKFQDLIDVERTLSIDNKNLYAQAYSMPIGKISDDQSAVVGVDGWQFIIDGSNQWEKQFLGSVGFSDADLNSWKILFEKRTEAAKLIGANFRHFVIPEKQSIYPELRWPGGVPKSLNDRPMIQLRKVIAENLIYPLEILQDESWRVEIFPRGNSHWTTSANWIGFCYLMKSIWPQRKFDFEIVSLFRNYLRHDLLVKFTKDICYEQVVSISRKSNVIYNNNLLTNTGAHVGNHFIMINKDAPYAETIVIYGDSYSYDVGFSDLISAFFQKVHFIWSTSIDFEYCEKMGANLIIMENAERFMIRKQISDKFI